MTRRLFSRNRRRPKSEIESTLGDVPQVQTRADFEKVPAQSSTSAIRRSRNPTKCYASGTWTPREENERKNDSIDAKQNASTHRTVAGETGSSTNRTALVARSNSQMSRKSNHVVTVLRTTSEVVPQFVLLYQSRPTRQVQMKMFLSVSVCAHSFPHSRLRRSSFVQKAEQFNTKCKVERLIMSEHAL